MSNETLAVEIRVDILQKLLHQCGDLQPTETIKIEDDGKHFKITSANVVKSWANKPIPKERINQA